MEFKYIFIGALVLGISGSSQGIRIDSKDDIKKMISDAMQEIAIIDTQIDEISPMQEALKKPEGTYLALLTHDLRASQIKNIEEQLESLSKEKKQLIFFIDLCKDPVDLKIHKDKDDSRKDTTKQSRLLAGINAVKYPNDIYLEVIDYKKIDYIKQTVGYADHFYCTYYYATNADGKMIASATMTLHPNEKQYYNAQTKEMTGKSEMPKSQDAQKRVFETLQDIYISKRKIKT